jgi:hypothetical protein
MFDLIVPKDGLSHFLVVNECLNPLQNDCSQNAECQDEPLGFICQCKVGFVDVGKRPGRNCVKGTKIFELNTK